jgi:hypothetical protein
MKAKDVRIGQRFRKHDKMGQLWIVAALSAAKDAIPHVRLTRSGAPGDSKTLAVTALTDPRYFTFDSEGAGDQSAP